ncbi:MAG: putative hydrolase [Thermoproteota archaeon]|nr:putative hydrolase [Thermoproteota archaeon]
MLKIDLHTHTLVSGHATNTIFEMIQVAREKGLELLGLAEHGPKVEGGPIASYFHHSIRLPRRLFNMNFIMGVEADIMDLNGLLDLNDRHLRLQDIVLAGIHREAGWTIKSPEENSKAIIEVMKNPLVHFISHPCDSNARIEVEKVVKASYEYQVPLEVNCLHLGYHVARGVDIEDIRHMIKLVRDYRWKLIISSDAHVATAIGDDSIIDKMKLRDLLSEDIILNSSLTDVWNFLEEKRKKAKT